MIPELYIWGAFITLFFFLFIIAVGGNWKVGKVERIIRFVLVIIAWPIPWILLFLYVFFDIKFPQWLNTNESD